MSSLEDTATWSTLSQHQRPNSRRLWQQCLHLHHQGRFGCHQLPIRSRRRPRQRGGSTPSPTSTVGPDEWTTSPTDTDSGPPSRPTSPEPPPAPRPQPSSPAPMQGPSPP
ncbi:hypothetical protein CEXT_669081 [Caerostris extrusa]|uniref:Uncharacterized protein n=1 Tax=Caerostris extrusa TaxID=172846 RepID=A0AAV4TFL5_CAEEX|nr:hypothetical protein CEXT_669081 [Caerostris extrusa]